MFVLDTNVASDLMRPAPAPTVVAWVAEHDADELYLPTLTRCNVNRKRETMSVSGCKKLVTVGVSDAENFGPQLGRCAGPRYGRSFAAWPRSRT